MSTVTEIEAALPLLSPEDLARVEAAVQRLKRWAGAARAEADLAALERANGFDVLPEREGARVTVEDVQRLCVEEGI